jgi:hypothetical protein
MKKDAAIAILVAAITLLVVTLPPKSPAAAQPQPTMTITPASGPCDATVEVTGAGFPASSLTESLGLYLLRPGTTDVNVGILNAAVVGQDGSFDESVPLRQHGCEEAALDARAQPPTGDLLIAARSGQTAVPPGDRIPNIIAVAQYAYTTTTPQPQPAMTITPSSGPCDATVEITGHDFPLNTAIILFMGAPKSDGTLGELGSLVTDPAGGFVTEVSLGSLGCQAAGLDDSYSGQLSIGADFENPAVNGEDILTRTDYTYTTAELLPGPKVLPSTGSGPEERSTSRGWCALAGAVGALGVMLVAASLYARRSSN